MLSNTAAVIVTYNRLEMLKHCIGKLRAQTLPVNDIIVVNNGSTDGTKEWLATQTQLIVFNQPNSGSAGGFYTGIKAAAEAYNYKWLWLMDDDGYPAEDCLENLIAATVKKPEVDVWGCIVLDNDNPDSLAFDCAAITTSNNKIHLSIEYVDNWAPFFNGILLAVNTVKKVGYPDPRLFIWGDEMEYFQRINNIGAIIKSTTKAVFYHPKDRLYDKVFKGEYVYDGPTNWKAYCFFRNRAYLGRKYHNSTRTKVLLKQFDYLYRKLSLIDFIKAVGLITRAHIDGLRYNLNKKLPY
ncbi:glycosyltransferase family 2 protein [Mucilaginibacter calamicampi]|uniref:Glycosyltransferase family 2 protein n=1 Tax=Mucilaginibacter calamicampi TaxID=1302352 RepID=A0ABW2YWE1_9SPHI